MDDAWDSENFETPNLKPIASGDKWEGEDEDDDVKDNWEDDEEENKDEEKQEEVKAIQVKKKKKIAEVIEEKERKAKEEAARKQAAREAMKELTPEEKLAEKLRQQRLQEEADLQVTLDTFGIVQSSESIDTLNPSTMDDFNILQDALVKKLTPLIPSVHFPIFFENLLRSICASFDSATIKKIKNMLHVMYSVKSKAEKGEKTKKGSKSKGRARLLVEGDNYSTFGAEDYEDFEDFI